MTDCRRLSFLANRLGPHVKSRSSTIGLGGYHKEKFKENENFLGGCKEGGRLDWREERA